MLQGVNEDLALPLLLRRPQIDHVDIRLPSIEGKRVMVTGAGGSIGSELVMQVAAHAPAHITLVDQSELALYEVNCTLAEAGFESRFPALADVRHEWCMDRLFSDERPDIVFHAAALKHVPLLENDHNLIEAVRTNVRGSANVAALCAECSAQMVMVSTDKAVRPTSVMGLTKRAAELAVAMIATRAPRTLSLATVRFGNVLGSSGSVVPLFRRQIAQGGPVTVTHEGMTRYFMTIKEAVGLVLKASIARVALDRYDAYLYVLDMGRPVRIVELAYQLIELAGLRPNIDIKIEITGVRPGEKLHEELSYRHEHLRPTQFAGMTGTTIDFPPKATASIVDRLLVAADNRSIDEVKRLLVALVPDYRGTGVWK
jgi:O-antigen biosynthesis protein WbqV